MNKRFAPVTLALGLVFSLPGAVLARGGHGGGFHGGGFHGGAVHAGGFRGGGAPHAAPHMAAPRAAAPAFHGGPNAGVRGAGAGAAALHHGPSLNYSRGYGGVGHPGGFPNAAVNHNFGMARQAAIGNRANAFRGNTINNRVAVNNMNMGNWHRGYWNGHWGNYGGNWGYGPRYGYGGFGPGLGYGGYGGYGYGGFGNPLLWGLGSGLGFGLGYGLLGGYGGYGMGYGGYGSGYGGYGMGYGGYGALAGWGLPSWGMGNWPYTYGYSSYANPYYTSTTTGAAYLNYSQPLAIDTTEPAQATVDTASTEFAAARDAFKAGDYNTALQKVDQALNSLPSDVDLHEFRSLTLFALGRYSESAAGLYAVLNRGPGWNWATISGLYPNVDAFTSQLRSLERYVAANPNAASPRFDLSYLYMGMGSSDAAADQLREVVKLEPDDQLSRQLLADVSPPTAGPENAAATATASTAPAPSPEEKEAPPPPPASLAGDWKAEGAGGTSIDLNLKPDNQFTWITKGKDGPKSFSGTAAIGTGILTLASGDGMVIVGRVTGTPNGGFKFKLIGGGPDDPGLTFSRTSS